MLNKVHCVDALELMVQLPDGSVDAIITDLPYGTTACSWDEIIPFEPMWEGVKRVLKPRGVFVTTASQPFTSKLVMSNLAWFKYAWVWNKSFAGNFATAAIMPLKTHEDICVFSGGGVNYYPQKSNRLWTIKGGGMSTSRTIDNHSFTALRKTYTDKFPISILDYPRDLGVSNQHPTQKPVALYEYLILTYTQPGDVVLDFCAGSGTTAVAAATLNRRFIAGDTDAGYCEIARRRLETVTQNMFEVYGGFTT